MIIQQLINEFYESSVGKEVIPKLKAQRLNEVYLHGITDSAKGFFLTTLIYSLNRPILYLANDNNSALNLYHEVLNLSNSTPINSQKKNLLL